MTINYKEVSTKLYEFFEEIKKEEIIKNLSNGEKFLYFSFEEILNFDISLSNDFLSNPKDCLMICEEVLKSFKENPTDKFLPRLTSLPDSEKILIRDIRTDHINKFIYLEGQIRRKTDVRPKLKEIQYLCTNPSCNFYEEKIRVPQLDEKTKELKGCPKCKSPLNIIKQVLVDSQIIVLEEIPEKLKNQADTTKRINIILEEDLVSPFKDNRTNPGSRVKVIGILKELPKITKTGAKSINYEIVILGNHMESLEDDFSDIKINKEEEEEIKKLAKDESVVDILVDNFSPSIYGNSKIKEAIILQLFGGTKQIKGDGIKVRGDIHILLIGDPGAAKSQMLKAATQISPRSSYVSGKSASGVGLTATVVKDELAGGWALEAGSLVLANGGLCAIDEMDKMDESDTSAMHEALEQQTISISKASIRATLICETTVLGAANPKFGRFNPYEDIAKQIDFPPALISRFDLIFVLKDIPNKKRDSLISTHILKSHKDHTRTKRKLDINFLRKYISYSRKQKPELTNEAIEEIKNFYVNIRGGGDIDNEEELKPVPITARQLEAIIRMSESYAKIMLDEKVTKKHTSLAIEMLLDCLQKIGYDPKTGELDIDRIATGVTTSQRTTYKSIRDIIDILEKEDEWIKDEDILKRAKDIKIDNEDTNKIITKLKEEGYIFQPRKDKIYKKSL
jgi:replicative DNA helicase Mcm